MILTYKRPAHARLKKDCHNLPRERTRAGTCRANAVT